MSVLGNCKPFTLYITFIAVTFALGALYYLNNKHKSKLHLTRFLLHKLIGVVCFSVLLLLLCHMNYNRTSMALVMIFFALISYAVIYLSKVRSPDTDSEKRSFSILKTFRTS